MLLGWCYITRAQHIHTGVIVHTMQITMSFSMPFCEKQLILQNRIYFDTYDANRISALLTLFHPFS